MPSWLTALLTVVAGGAVGALFNWLAGRHRDQREGNKDQREEDQADIDRLRNIANDALSREKLAYERVTRAESKAGAAEVEIETLRKEVNELKDRVKLLEGEAKEAKDRATSAEQEAKQLRQHVDLLTDRLKQQGMKVPGSE